MGRPVIPPVVLRGFRGAAPYVHVFVGPVNRRAMKVFSRARFGEQAGDEGLFSGPVCCASGIPVYALPASKHFAPVHASLALEHDASAHGSLASLPLSSGRVLSVPQHFASGRAFSALQCLASGHVLLDAASRDLLLYASADA